jgi:hypothetical protein
MKSATCVSAVPPLMFLCVLDLSAAFSYSYKSRDDAQN